MMHLGGFSELDRLTVAQLKDMCAACGVAVGGSKGVKIGRLESYKHPSDVAGCHGILQMMKLTKATLQGECARRGITKSGNHTAILIRILAADTSSSDGSAQKSPAAASGRKRKAAGTGGVGAKKSQKKAGSNLAAASPAASPASSPPAPFTDRPNQTNDYHQRLMAA